MATPKEQHDARDRARDERATRERQAEVKGPLSPSSAAPVRAEQQADGQPENELELHDHSGGAAAGREVAPEGRPRGTGREGDTSGEGRTSR